MKLRNGLLGVSAAILLFGAGLLTGANQFGKPKSVVHVVTVRWKADSKKADQDEALKGVEKMASEIPGIKNVWVKTLKVQGENYSNAFAMEFQDEAAFKAYTDAPAHVEWNKKYVAIRDQSTTHDISN